MVDGGRPLLPEIWGQADPVAAKSPIFSRYSLVSLSGDLAKNFQLTLIESRLRVFQ